MYPLLFLLNPKEFCFCRLLGNGALVYRQDELNLMLKHFSDMSLIGSMESSYVSVCGANMFLYLMRVFKLLDFQPKIGMLTRTIANAMDDLMHFMLLLAVVFLFYIMMGAIVFGPTISVRFPVVVQEATLFLATRSSKCANLWSRLTGTLPTHHLYHTLNVRWVCSVMQHGLS